MPRKKYTLTCQHCHQPFNPWRPRARFCTMTCRDLAYWPETRVFSRIAITPNDSDCWLWQGKRNSQGYGCLTIGGNQLHATRLLWTLTIGPIPDGFYVCHRCDNPPCCNLSHLFLGTQADNVSDAQRKGRLSRGTDRWNAKLTERQVRQIRAATGTATAIAARFGVSRRLIRRIKRGELWRHVQ